MSYSGAYPYTTRLGTGEAGIGDPQARVDVSTDVANILCCPFSTDRTDLTGNHTFVPATSSMQAAVGHSGETMVLLQEGIGDRVSTTTGEGEHAIGGTDPVTFGAFFRTISYGSTAQIMTSSANGGSANYGLIRFTNGDWGFRGASGGGSGSAWRVMVNRSPEDAAGFGRFFHVAMRCDSGSNTGAFFWNGVKVWEGTFGTNGRHTAVPATDRFNLNESSGSVDNTRWDGYMGNLFIADSALSDSQIKLLSDQAFGHASSWTAGAI